MPILQTLGGATGWGKLKRQLGLYWAILGTGSGYGSKTTGRLGNFYYQTYGVTRKLTKNGEFVWGRSLGIGNVYAIGTDSSENVYIAGPDNFFAAKYDSNGTMQWQRTLTPSGVSGYAQDMVTNDSGTSYLAGDRVSGGVTYAAIACVSSSGSVLWSQYNTTADTHYIGVGHSSSANLTVAAGHSGGGGRVDVTAYNATTGAVQWQRTITTTDSSLIFGMGCAVDTAGNVYVSGMSGSSPRHSFIVKYNISGTMQWARQLEIPGVYSYNDYATPGIDSDGNVYISFYLDNNNIDSPNNGGGFAKFNSSGTLQFIRKLNTIYGWLRINVAPDGTVALMGTDGLAKLKGDGSGLGTYSGFTYASSSLQAVTPSFNYGTAGHGYAGASFTATATSNSVSTPTINPAIQYIGTEVG